MFKIVVVALALSRSWTYVPTEPIRELDACAAFIRGEAFVAELKTFVAERDLWDVNLTVHCEADAGQEI